MYPPLLSKPHDNEILQLYLAVSSNAVSAVLVREEDKHQHPIYYVSKSLLDAETRYTSMENLLLALVTAVKKLRVAWRRGEASSLKRYIEGAVFLKA